MNIEGEGLKKFYTPSIRIDYSEAVNKFARITSLASGELLNSFGFVLNVTCRNLLEQEPGVYINLDIEDYIYTVTPREYEGWFDVNLEVDLKKLQLA